MRHAGNEGTFKRDVEIAQRQGRDLGKRKALAGLLIGVAPLPATCLDHPLRGRWRSFRDTHIEPDWLLIYKLDGDTVCWRSLRIDHQKGFLLTGN